MKIIYITNIPKDIALAADDLCFDLKAKDYSNVQLAMQLNISESTVTIVMRRVRTKITKVLNWEV